jgi:hypothetical protein
MNEYGTRRMTYAFEGRIEQFEIPYENIEETRPETTEPAQTETSPLAKVLVKTEG